MLRLAAITVVAGLVGPVLADAPRPTTVRDIVRLGPGENTDDLSLVATVTYCDPIRRCLIVQDGEYGLLVRIPLETRRLKPGDRAEVHASGVLLVECPS